MNREDSVWTERLSGRISKGEVLHYAQSLHNDEAGIGELCALVCGTSHKKVAMNGAWIIFHLAQSDNAAYMPEYRDMLMDFAMRDNIAVRRGLIITILLNIPEMENPRTDYLDYCMNGFLSSVHSDSSRAAMIKAAARICEKFPELQAELLYRLSLLPPGLPPSIECVRRKVISQCGDGENEF